MTGMKRSIESIDAPIKAAKKRTGSHIVVLLGFYNLFYAVCIDGTFTCTVCLEERPLLSGKLLSCCAPIEEGGHGRNLCALNCFQQWVETGGPHCPTCRKSWADEVPRGKWLQRKKDACQAFDEEAQFLEHRISTASRRFTVRITAVEVREDGNDIHLTTVERDIAAVPAVGNAAVMVELDVAAERLDIKRRRSRVLADIRHLERVERSRDRAERTMNSVKLEVEQGRRSPTKLEVATDAYFTCRDLFLATGTQDALNSLLDARNNLFVAQALGPQLDLMDADALQNEAVRAQMNHLEHVGQYPPAPGSGPLLFRVYLNAYCTDRSIE